MNLPLTYKAADGGDMTKAEKLAIDILNKMHAEHGLQEVMKCKFCTSQRAELILSEALAPLIVACEERNNLKEVLEDTRRLARELDVALHGENDAAKQASLCDLIVPAQRLREERDRYKTALDWSAFAHQLERELIAVCEERDRYKADSEALGYLISNDWVMKGCLGDPDCPEHLCKRLEGK